MCRSGRRAACVLAAALFLPSMVAGQNPAPLYYDDPSYGWLDNRDPESPRASPSAIVGLQLGFTRVWVTYGRPGVKGRTVMGRLVPWGVAWRIGADELPVLTTSGPITVEGQELSEGSYALYAIPGADEWTVAISEKHNQWGGSIDQRGDVVRFPVLPHEGSFEERMSFSFDDLDPEGGSATLVLKWARTRIPIRISESF